MTNSKLNALIKMLASHNVTQFEDGSGLKITLGPKPATARPTPKDLSEKTKQKEQQDEELLFHSAQR